MRIEIIYWKDAAGHGENTWREADDMEDLISAHVKSVGFVYKETDDYIILVGSEDMSNKLYHSDICILKVNIKERHKLWP